MRLTQSTQLRAWRAVLLATIALLAALGGASSALADDNGPLAGGGSVTPSSLDFHGGQVTITASGLDDFGIAMFYADVTGPDGPVASVLMLPSHIPDDPSSEYTEYSGVFNVPGNVHEYPVSYQFNSAVTDTNGQVASAYLGEVTVGEIQAVDEAPYLWEPTVSARTLPSTGGLLTVDVHTFDDHSVASASARVRGPGGFMKDVDLSPTDQTIWQGRLAIPANTGTTQAVYSVTFSASDDIGQQGTIDGGLVTVAAPAAPQPGLLALAPAARFIGPVYAGRTARGSVVLRNTGKPGSGLLVATATVSGPFAMVGAGPFGLPLSLAPGESKVLVAEFRPKRGGLYSGRITVTRPDGRQRPLVAQLTGLALP